MISVHGHGKAFTLQYSLLANINKVIELFRSTSRLDLDLGPWILNLLFFYTNVLKDCYGLRVPNVYVQNL